MRFLVASHRDLIADLDQALANQSCDRLPGRQCNVRAGWEDWTVFDERNLASISIPH